MSNQFTINGHVFEDGFSWIALTTPTDAAIAEAISAKGHGCYVALGSRENHDTISGIALGSKEVKHSSGKSYSLAALIYDVYKLNLGIDHFVYVREMGDDGYYYLEVSGGYIQEGDIIIPSPEKLHDIFSANAGSHLEIYIDSPNADLVADSFDYRAVSTEELIAENGLNSRHIIKTPNDARIKLFKNIAWIVIAAGAVYGLYLGGVALKNWWDAQNKQEVTQKSAEQIALEKRAKAEQVVGQRLKAQTAGFPAVELSRACLNSYLFQGGDFKVAGWQLKSITCNAGGLKTDIEQNNIYEVSGDELKSRFSNQPAVMVSVSKSGDWLEKAQLTVKDGFSEMQSKPGLYLEELPPAGEAASLVKTYLKTLYRTGFGVDDIKEVKITFPPEQEIPEELLYFEGRFSISASSLSHLNQATSRLNYDWMRLATIEFSVGDKQPRSSGKGGDLPYKAKFNYYFK